MDTPALRESEPSDSATSSSAETRALDSEDRVARFMISQLGRPAAEEKALANAAWYGPDTREHIYWQKVASAISRNPGN